MQQSKLLEHSNPPFLKRGQLFQIAAVYSEKKPPMFKLVDLLKDSVKGLFYKEQLTKSPAPKSSDYFFVEKILGEKKIQGKKHYLVKYLFYPSKFNQYVPEENLKKNN